MIVPGKMSLTRLEEKSESHHLLELIPGTFFHSHGTWINDCVSKRVCEFFWLRILLIKHQVVVPRECQSFIVIVLTVPFSRLPLFTLRTPLGADGDMVTTLGKRGEKLRKLS